MGAARSVIVVSLTLTFLATACAGPQGRAPQSGAEGGSADASRGVPRRIVAAIQGDPHTVYQQLNPASRVRGIETLEQLVAAALTTADTEGSAIPQLAEAVPSIENSLWKLFPDGRMETRWRIRDAALWHDGVPFTTADVLFTSTVARDKDLPIFGNAAWELVEAVQAPDPRTVVVTWSQPFIEADALFSHTRTVPFPRHLLEKAYADDRAGFIDHPYWSHEFIGAGPFKVKEWVRGSHLIFDANDRYVLGRPKIDEVEVRFIPDANTLMANLLAGTVELTLGRSLSGEQAVEVKERSQDIRMELSFENWVALYPQFVNPNPAVVADVRFRRATMHAIDRQQLVDVLLPSLSSVAHSWLRPGQPEYREIEARNVVRYEYEPRRTGELAESLGYRKGPDGFYQDSGGKRLSVEIRTTIGDDLREKMLLTIADSLQRTGIGVETVIVPRQLAADLEYRAQFPAFELVRNPNDVRGLRSLHSRYTPLPENNFRLTGNRPRYINPQFDGLVDRFFATIPKEERRQVMGQIIHHISDQLVIMGILYNTSPTLVSNRLLNVSAGGEGSTQAWNAHLWDVRS